MTTPAPRARPLTARLVEEHGLLRRALAVYGRYAAQVVSGKRYDPRLAGDFVRFFGAFCERRHVDQEERVLFPWMESHGIPRESGPLVVLRSEHDLGRDLLKSLDGAGRALLHSPGERATRVRFHGLTLRFIELFTVHMDKEERALFRLARRIAARNASVLHSTGGLPERERAWIDALE